MTDNLVKRLRDKVEASRIYDDDEELLDEAADHIEKLEAALIDILKVPRSEASWGIALVIAHHALKEGKDD